MTARGKSSKAKTPQNTFRFLPGRTPTEKVDKILFTGIRYSRTALEDPKMGFLAGVAIGPGQHQPKDAEGPGFMLSPGGRIVPAYPDEKLQTVPVRDFKVPGDKTGKAKQYIDFATFKEIGPDLFRVVPCDEDKVAYGEIWTGDIEQTEGVYQLIQANMFAHGSVAYAGGTVVINAADAKAKKKKPTVTAPGSEEQGARASKAEMMLERQGNMVAGIPLWTARLWRLNYSATDSEMILVRQLDKYYLVGMRNGMPHYQEVPASAYAKQFERLLGDDLMMRAASGKAA